MIKSCIKHIPKARIAILREDFIQICQGDKAAALLLSFFEYWHNIKIEQSQKSKITNDVAEKHGYERMEDETLFQFHTSTQLYNGLLKSVGRSAIQRGIKILQDLKYITVHKNLIQFC